DFYCQSYDARLSAIVF
nr:immunoglobulin light chain junction region [Macaca mulatta]MOX11587.1 immunoglobulin light chain junction region [Macaca mulatta]MOX12315.1 immunoglobulin light chain junction region [Macaca mulatta]MOX12372.1 immunoglobulin light chain junction region [Macaca mulatta]MOX12419.1 immunoglobulin light chain junction region [Macaca mulatta]